MNVAVMDWVDSQHDLSPTERFVLTILCRLADEDLWVRKTQDAISQKTGYSIRAVRNALKKMKEAGILKSRPEFDADGRLLCTSHMLQMR
jgi:DNA-binding transcriptional ArsR family regulator